MSKRDATGARTFVARCYEEFGAELNRYLRRQLRRRCADPQDARDLAQEVWCRLLRIKDTTQVLEPLAYIHTSALNVVREHDHLARRNSRSIVDSEMVEHAAEHPSEYAPDEMADNLVRQSEFDRALATLPRVQREVLFLKINEGCNWQEIGEKLNLSPNTVYMYFWRAMTLIKKSRRER